MICFSASIDFFIDDEHMKTQRDNPVFDGHYAFPDGVEFLWGGINRNIGVIDHYNPNLMRDIITPAAHSNQKTYSCKIAVFERIK